MGSARLAPALSAGHRFGTCFCCLCEAGAPEFEQVVGGCDQLPFGLARAEAATEEAVGAADAFRVREDGFDDLLASAVERLSLGLRERRLDSLRFVALAGRELARSGAPPVKGGDEHVDALLAHVGDRGRVPVAAVREQDPDRLL